MVAALTRPERLSALLEPFVPDAEDRDFVVRCITREGPVHHRGANFALLGLLGALLDELGARPKAPKGETVGVPLRLPPHLAHHRDTDTEYPLQMPVAILEKLAPKGSPELDALIDCLLDGPAHHALANAALICLLDAVFAHLGDGDP
ncbi:MAG: hypothetical protein HUU21_11250 [Polyangiaceae bacterium]|nr:hypothetical protein [Polyangiaceae bacterium]